MKKFRVVVNGSEYNVEIEELSEQVTAPRPVAQTSSPAPVAQPKPASPAPAKPAAPQDTSVGGAIVAPMPGTILSVAVEAGATVKKGQTLLVLEAMKMENEIQAPADGVVQQVNVSKGLSVNAGDTLIVLS
ncbi:biotin/lipoyl-containing protein [Desulforhopalus sp. IMCC35007]|uniref:biotin/lipoyl-containing protein n=1 Tax=Desulforhopalus sp. IMCC35007 TaxID=2569543 RepID=UPI0010AE8059|nr:biotin/lipoyl-containing protein [Desulforhopalus sp. IMCC35007]TKB09113.1 biotin/lipoyl-binding protein [Desulforhopalus sp. IMCC35007]